MGSPTLHMYRMLYHDNLPFNATPRCLTVVCLFSMKNWLIMLSSYSTGTKIRLHSIWFSLWQATTPQSFDIQGCFAIDYDFATHRCYFFAVNVLIDAADDPVFLHCIIEANVPQPSSLGLKPNPTVVHITLCKSLLLWISYYVTSAKV